MKKQPDGTVDLATANRYQREADRRNKDELEQFVDRAKNGIDAVFASPLDKRGRVQKNLRGAPVG